MPLLIPGNGFLAREMGFRTSGNGFLAREMGFSLSGNRFLGREMPFLFPENGFLAREALPPRNYGYLFAFNIILVNNRFSKFKIEFID